MVDVEFRVVGDRREGLLLALGQIVIAGGFTLLRQRLVTGNDGVELTMVVRGPSRRLLQLEENLGSHPLVRSFESTQAGSANTTSAPVRTSVGSSVAVPGDSASAISQSAITHRVEALLPQLARDYPNIFLHLRALEYEMHPEQYESALCYIGQRVGAWVYKRDFALGGRLSLTDAVRFIALPAMRQIVQAGLEADSLQVTNSPFCHRGQPGACCHFLRGMLGGLLGNAHGVDGLQVVESECRNTGADVCSFEFRV